MVNTVYLAGPAARLRAGLQLQYLDVSDCPAVDDTSVRLAVENCTQLQYLFLRRCTNITGYYNFLYIFRITFLQI